MPSGRRLLLTNDDGFQAEGLQHLAEGLEPLGEVWVVAPNREQSAAAHSLTLDRPLRVQQLGERRYAVDGTPTDCVAVALGHIMETRPPEIVVSGVNFGVNMGADVHYSGTVSAAFEGVISGLPALAVSQEIGKDFGYGAAVEFAARLVAWSLQHGLSKNTLLNVNVPASRPGGVEVTRLGTRRYSEGVVRQTDPRGREIFWIGGGKPIWSADEGTDFPALAAGRISVTPLHLDMTATELLPKLRAELEGLGGDW